MKSVVFLPLLLLVACNEDVSSRETQAIKLGHLEFEIPSDWRTLEQPPAGQLSGAWTPPSNDRKESIVIARSEVDLSLVTDGSSARLEQMLRQADAALPHARATPPMPMTTEQGLHGLRLSVDFVPPGSKEVYHRVHVVLRDKDAVIHVIYTAISPEPANEPLEILLSTLRHEEA